MEGFEVSLLSGTRNPCLAAVQQCADDTGVVDCHIVFTKCLGFIHKRVIRLVRVVSAFAILLSISTSKEKPFGDGGTEVRKVMDIDCLTIVVPTMILDKEII